jgi:hypothetical protein
MVLDAYERTTNAQPLVVFTNSFHGFLADHGRNWSHNLWKYRLLLRGAFFIFCLDRNCGIKCQN